MYCIHRGIFADPHWGEGLQPAPRPSKQEQRTQHGRHRHHAQARDGVQLQGKVKSKAWI